MALPTATPAPPLSPQVVGNAFVEQYYHVLYQSPELVYRFYQESSILSRPDSNGVMRSVTTTQAINDMVLSLDYKNYIAEIMTADSQPSYKDGVFILVTGCLTGQDKNRRKFSQSFFLAPQDNGGYFVLNDVFRFVDDGQPKEANQVVVSGTHDAPKAPLTPEPVQDLQSTDSTTLHSAGLPENGEEVRNQSENGGSVVEKEVVVDPKPVHPSHTDPKPVHLSHIDPKPDSEIPTSVVQEDVPKKSYASIVKRANGSAPKPVYVPTTKAKPAVPRPEKPSVASSKPASAPELPATSTDNTSEINKTHEEEGHSIYIRNLPLNATAPQIEEEFKKFGPIKTGGVQVRSHKADRFCFGFVEFESLDAMHSAIEASPVLIGGRQVYVEEKRTSTRVVNGVVSSGGSNGGNGRGRYPVGRGGGVRNDNFRGGRGGFGGNQGGFARNEFRSRGGGEYSGRGRSVPGRAGEGYHPRIVQNGYGRMGRPNMMNQATVAA